MNPSEVLPNILRSLLTQLPVILVCLVGSILVLGNRKSLQKAAFPALCGLALGLLESLAGPVIWAILPKLMNDSSPSKVLPLMTLVGFGQALCWALALGLLVLAVFTGRSQERSSTL